MKTREEIIDIYLNQYSNDIAVRKIGNPFYIPDEQSVVDSMWKTEEMYKDFLAEITLTDAEKIIVLNKIKSVHSIYQEEGDAILGDYEHDYEWYENFLKDHTEEYYWERYKNYLAVQKHFPPEVIKLLEYKTLRKIMSYLGNPNDTDSNGFSVRGLVVGDVQSGKTSNYLGLVTKAADAGYRIIFILTGTIESLRKQTQERVEEGFVGYDVTTAMDVGVGRGDKMPKSFTSRLKDFVADDDQNTNIRISNYPSEPMIFVLKKNASVLKKLYTSLKNINTTKQYQRINVPMLLIDDEADNASINTHKPEDDPTKINKYIRNILSLFTKSSYVGFTATPFANDKEQYSLYIRSKATRQLLIDYREKMQSNISEIEKIKDTLRGYQKSLNEYNKSRTETNAVYKSFFAGHMKELDIPDDQIGADLEPGAYIVASGAYGPRCKIAQVLSFIQTQNKISPNIVKMPLVIDSPNVLEQDKEHLETTLNTLFTWNETDNQIIVASVEGKEIAEKIDGINVISLSNEKNKLLNESEYLLNQDLINRVIIDI